MIDDKAKSHRHHPRLMTDALFAMVQASGLPVAPDRVARARLAHRRPQLHWSQKPA